MEPSTTFADRLAYARVLRHFFGGEAPGNAEIGRAVDRTGQWVTRWASSETPPRDYEVHGPIAAFLDVDGDPEALELWLFRNRGEPPHPELWSIWLKARRRQTKAASVEDFAKVPRAKPVKKTKSGG